MIIFVFFCRRTLHLDGNYYSELLKTHIIPSVSTDPDIVICLSTCPNETLSTSEVDAYMVRTNVSLCRYDITSYVSDDNKCLKPVAPQYVKRIFANKTHVHVFQNLPRNLFKQLFNLCLFRSNLLSKIIYNPMFENFKNYIHVYEETTFCIRNKTFECNLIINCYK